MEECFSFSVKGRPGFAALGRISVGHSEKLPRRPAFSASTERVAPPHFQSAPHECEPLHGGRGTALSSCPLGRLGPYPRGPSSLRNLAPSKQPGPACPFSWSLAGSGAGGKGPPGPEFSSGRPSGPGDRSPSEPRVTPPSCRYQCPLAARANVHGFAGPHLLSVTSNGSRTRYGCRLRTPRAGPNAAAMRPSLPAGSFARSSHSQPDVPPLPSPRRFSRDRPPQKN